MANIKIAQLTNQTSLSDTDLVIIESATSTNKMTVGKLKELLGIQSGGIVESGSNSKGAYIKFSDGLLIQYSLTPIGILANQSFADVTYPIPFTGANMIIPSQRNINVNDAVLSANNISTTTGRVYRNPVKNTQADFVYIAIGRWK